MRKSILVLLLIFTICKLRAQDNFYSTYTWETSPSYSVENESKGLVALKEKIVEEYLFEDDAFVEYYIEHRVLWLNSDDAIEEYNKVYLPLSSSSSLIENKARVITSDGKIIELDNSKILSATDEETGRNYKYFAFEGIEKGSFIEYYYIQKKSPSIYGKKLNFQYTYDKYNVEFDLFSPTNLEFSFKSYNGLPEVVYDSTLTDKKHWSFKADFIKGLEKEEGAPYDASKAFLVFKIHKNNFNNKIITSYSSVAQDLYAIYYQTYDKRVERQLDDLISEMDIQENMSVDEKIRRVDYYLKKNFYLSEGNADALEELESVLSNKSANDRGFVKLFVAIFRKLDIKNEFVLTCDRSQLKFDEDFEANNFLQEFLLYFPKTKKFLAPDKLGTFYGFPPPNLMDNYGLFIQEVKVGDYVSAVSKVKYIKPLKAEISKDDMLIEVSFNPEDLTQVDIDFKREMSGYYGMYIHPFLDLIPPDNKEEVLNSFAKNIDENAEVTERQMENDDPKLFGAKPLIIDYDITSESFVEKAGNKYLFKLGNLIGPQIEMYQENERILPYENEFNRSYIRSIQINIPEGFEFSNLEDINIDNKYVDDKGNELFSFTSSYEKEGNILKVVADEHYRENIIPLDIFESFRTVINSAADFNKITLVLVPVD